MSAPIRPSPSRPRGPACRKNAATFFARAPGSSSSSRAGGARLSRARSRTSPRSRSPISRPRKIVELLAQGDRALFGLTRRGPRAARKSRPPMRHVVFIDGLGFGHAQRGGRRAAGLDRRAQHGGPSTIVRGTAFRLKHERKMRLATKLCEPHARFLFRAWDHGLPHRGKHGRNRGRRRRAGNGRAHRRPITTTGATARGQWGSR